jgi:pimeloyl-ACP methyl ester carboxylesterase
MSADVVFIHGGGQGSWVWAPTIAAMTQQAGGNAGHMLALDAPGCGVKRGRATRGISFDDIVDELIADIDAAGLKNVMLVGHSQAGTVLPRMAQLRPDLFKRLVYVSCIAPSPGATIRETLGNSLHGQNDYAVGWAIDPATTSAEQRYRLMFCNDMPPDQAEKFIQSLGADAWPVSSYAEQNWRYDQLAAMPASYVVLLKDMSLPVIWQERFAQRVQADRMIRIDAGHQAMVTRPHALAEILLAE